MNIIFLIVGFFISFMVFTFIWSNLILSLAFALPFTNFLIKLGPVSKKDGKKIKRRYLYAFTFQLILSILIVISVNTFISSNYHSSIMFGIILSLTLLIFNKGWRMDPGNVEEYFKLNYNDFKDPGFIFFSLKQDIDLNIETNRDMKDFLSKLYNIYLDKNIKKNYSDNLNFKD